MVPGAGREVFAPDQREDILLRLRGFGGSFVLGIGFS